MGSLRIIVAGLAGLHPVGGVAWDYLQYVVGLSRMGHDVYYYEDTWSWPFDPVRNSFTSDPRYSIRFIKRFFQRYAPELVESWRYVHLHDTPYGVSDERWTKVLQTADVFINVSGASIIPSRLPASCIKVFVDTDPGYNQVVLLTRPAWSENVDRWAGLVAAHDRHVTYAENIGESDCEVPLVGIDWLTTRMPIVMDYWDSSPLVRQADPWTTVMTWNAFKGPLRYAGRTFVGKGPEFQRILGLPGRVRAPFRVAIGGTEAPAQRIAAAGWSVVDGPTVSSTPHKYRQYIRRSCGEISVAKDIYVRLRSGWFSCRTACYLAAGRPAVVQDTGFSQRIPSGEGLFAFDSELQARDAIEAVIQSPQRHSRAAKELATEYFAASRVLGAFLDDLYATGGRRGVAS